MSTRCSPRHTSGTRMATLLLLAIPGAVLAGAQPSPISLQGILHAQQQPATGAFDFEVAVFDVASGGSALHVHQLNDVPVAEGRLDLRIELDPTVAGDREVRFLELRLRTAADGGAYQVLQPRQRLRSTPAAIGASGVQAGGVARPAIAAGAVAGPALQLESVATEDIADAAVGSQQLANFSIFGSRIVDGSIGEAALAVEFPNDLGAVIAGAGLLGGAGSGAVALEADSAFVQRRVGSICREGEAISAFHQDGSITCTPMPGFTLITTVAAEFDVGHYASIGISDGLPTIAYRDVTRNRVRVLRCSNAACSDVGANTEVELPSSSQMSHHIDLAIGTNGLPLIAFSPLDGNQSGMRLFRCGDAACNTHSLTEGALFGAQPSLAQGSHPWNVVISYFHQSGDDNLLFTRCANLFCSEGFIVTGTLDPADGSGYGSAIALDSQSRPAISYHDVQRGSLHFIRCGDVYCQNGNERVTLSAPVLNDVGSHSDIVLDAADRPRISYYDATAGALRLASCDTATCSNGAILQTIAEPANGNDVGRYNSIALGHTGLPVISYYDATAGALKLARCTTATCEPGSVAVSTIDAPVDADVGQYASMVIGTNGLPIISYYDATNGDLKVARCGRAACN